MADREHRHRDLWVGLTVGLFVTGPGLSIALLSLERGQPHVSFWPHAGEIAGLVMMAVGVFLGVAVVRGWWLPGGFRTGASLDPSPVLPLQPARVDVKITSTQRADWLLLNVQNNGATARFSAEVLIIIRKELSGAIEPSWWPVPWIADGQTGASIAPAEIPTGQTGILDFARHDPNAGQPATSEYEALTNLSVGRRSGPASEKATDIVHKGETVHLTEEEAARFLDPNRHRVPVIRPAPDASLSASRPHHWHFTSAPLPITVSYRPPIKSLHDLSTRRFVTTVRISRSEPPGHADRTFEVGIGTGQALACEPVALKVTILDRDWKDWHLRHFIVSVRVRIENTTARTIWLAPVFWMESDPRDVPPPDRDDPRAIRQDIFKVQEHRTPSLFDRREIPPYDSISGWLVHWVSRSEHGGKPHCWLILRDEVGGLYPVRVEPEP